MVARIRLHLEDSLFINTYLLIAIRLLGTGLGFLFWALAARIVAADEVGIASGAVSATLLLGGLGQLGLGYGLVRHLVHSEDPSRLINFSLLLSGLAGLGLAFAFLVSMTVLSPALLPLRGSVTSSFVFVTLVFCTTLSQLLNWVFLAKRQLIFSLMKHSVQTVSAIILLLALQPLVSGFASVIAAYMLATSIGLGFSLFVFLPVIQPDYTVRIRPQMSLRSSFTSYSFTNYLADQFQRAPSTLIPLIAIHQMGPQLGAYFFVAWAIGTGISAWSGSISDSLFAEGASDPAKASQYLFRAVRWGMLMTSGITAIVLLGGRFLLLTYGPQYAEYGTELLFWVAFSSIPAVILSILVSFLRIQDQLGAVVVIKSASAGGGVVLTWIGMSWLGLVGAGIGWTISIALVLVGCVVLWRWIR